MKTFHCTACESLVFFENTKCLACGRSLAYVPEKNQMVALEQASDGSWASVRGDKVGGESYFLCNNYVQHDVCNWALPAGAPQSLCRSCGLTHTIPNLEVLENRVAWAKLETAKRRMVYALTTLDLPLKGKTENPKEGLEFRFLSDSVEVNGDRSRVLTGHDNGLITINVAEADDVYREKERLAHREPYRTLLGHFRHEIGHYYWDRLVAQSPNLQRFRDLFGDETFDYQVALQQHYDKGAPGDWESRFISAYASMHPWEDWAECWAHVMHMVDALETAHYMGLTVKPRRSDEPQLDVPPPQVNAQVRDFDLLIREWSALTYVLNNLTRGLGLADAYPFVLAPPVIEKLRFVCEVMVGASTLVPKTADAA